MSVSPSSLDLQLQVLPSLVFPTCKTLDLDSLRGLKHGVINYADFQAEVPWPGESLSPKQTGTTGHTMDEAPSCSDLLGLCATGSHAAVARPDLTGQMNPWFSEHGEREGLSWQGSEAHGKFFKVSLPRQLHIKLFNKTTTKSLSWFHTCVCTGK